MTFKISSLFRDHAVFQRNIPLPVWGVTVPETQVRCSLGGCRAMTISNECGRFALRLPPLPAGGPHELVFENLQDGDRIVYKDIWIGEVYLTSGQSNMEFQLKNTDSFEQLKNAGRLDNSAIHYLKVPISACPSRKCSFEAVWQAATPETAGDFSAVGFLFAEKVARETGLKVGIINASCGGTAAESWMSREALMTHPLWKKKVTEYDVSSFDCSHYEELPDGQFVPAPGSLLQKMLGEQFAELPENEGLRLGYAEPDFDDSIWRAAELPDSWTLMGYNHGGVFWARLAVNLPQSAAGRDLTLSLGAIDKGDITYFNGVEVGRMGDGVNMEFWNQPRVYKVPGKLVRSGSNVIAVRAASFFPIAMAGGMIGPASQMFLDTGDTRIPLNVEWKYMMEYNAGIAAVEALSQCGPGQFQSQHVLFDNMISPLIPFALRGIIWYQGEANAICKAAEYKNLLRGLIHDWRYRWGQPDMDFIVIQLPGYQARRLVSPHSQWALLREAQILSGEPLVVTCDTGDENDIHPRDKSVVAERTADLAIALINKHRPVHSPRMHSVTRTRGKLLIKFAVYGSTLVFKGKPDGFAVGEGGMLLPAQAKIIGDDTVELSHPGVKNPQIIYYGWSNFPIGTLYNTHGLPAAPFRHRLKH